jgi:hypothetical protein
MDVGSIFLILALALIVFLFISRPFFERQSEGGHFLAGEATLERDHQHSGLLAERDRLLNALEELDSDNALGKVPEENYTEQRDALLTSGALVFQKLDEFEQSLPGRAAGEKVNAGESDDLEALIAARRRARDNKKVNFCHKCGTAIQQDDTFCSSCGTKI